MILLNDFYTIMQQELANGSIRAKIAINGKHEILEGHFPGLPIVPGVCMMQIIRELMEVTTSHPLRLIGADNMKFLSVINPDKDNEVDVLINYSGEPGHFFINATLFSGSITFFKLKATLKIIE